MIGPIEYLMQARLEDLRREIEQAQLAAHLPSRPRLLGAWLEMLRRRLRMEASRVSRQADEPVWPKLKDYPYGGPP